MIAPFASFSNIILSGWPLERASRSSTDKLPCLCTTANQIYCCN